MLCVHSIETFTTSDWPWIRLIVFLQWCNFRCLYCSNPDTIPCKFGTMMTDEEIITLVEKGKMYFKNWWGITFSWWEPLLQAKELLSICKKLKRKKINICVDTNWSILNDDVKKLLPYIDLLLPDIKQINEEKHKKLTWQSFEPNKAFITYLEKIKKPYRMNYMVIPWYTDNKKDIEKTGEYIKSLKYMEQFEVLPYHTLGKYKWEKLGWKYELENVPLPTKKDMEKVVNILKKYTNKIKLHA